MEEFSTVQVIVMSAMAHVGAYASHGAWFGPLGPQPWHRETTRTPRAAGPHQRQGVVIWTSVSVQRLLVNCGVYF